MSNHYCWNCKYYFEDRSVGVAECECDEMLEEDYDSFCVKSGGYICPYFNAIKTDEQLRAEEDYYDRLMEEASYG